MVNPFGFGLSNPTKFSMDFPWDSKQFYRAKTYRFSMQIWIITWNFADCCWDTTHGHKSEDFWMGVRSFLECGFLLFPRLLFIPLSPSSHLPFPSTRCYIFIDRLFVLSLTMAVSSMVLRENLTYVYWIRYRTMHSGYSSVPSEPHLPQVCVFKPMNLHSTYGEECWMQYSLRLGSSPSNPAYNIQSSAQNSKFHSL